MTAGIASLHHDLRAGRTSALEVTRRCLERARGDTEINAFIEVTGDLVIAQAERVDRALADGADPGPLAGVPIAVKDIFDVAGLVTTVGSRRYALRVADRTATAVQRLLAAGAVLIGKANMDSFAFGPNQEDFGRTNCPADTSRYAGGSSGGSAAAVAAGMAMGALGTDAGGSTRFPASCCGVAGFKPTFGRVPTDGIRPTFATVDHVGVIARSVADLRQLFAVVAGGTMDGHLPPGPLRLAVLTDWQAGCEPEVVQAVSAALETLAADGTGVTATDLTGMGESIDLLLTTVAAEAAEELESELATGTDGIPPGLVELLRSGSRARAVDYVRAQRRRAALAAMLDEVLRTVDAVVLPTSATTAWAWAGIDGDLGARAEATRFLPLTNLTGHPAISLPLPVGAGRLPVGLQLIGARGGDEQLLGIAARVERTLGGHLVA